MLQQRYHSRSTMLDNAAGTDRTPLTPEAGLFFPQTPDFAARKLRHDFFRRRNLSSGTEKMQENEGNSRGGGPPSLPGRTTLSQRHLFQEKCRASAQLCCPALCSSIKNESIVGTNPPGGGTNNPLLAPTPVLDLAVCTDAGLPEN